MNIHTFEKFWHEFHFFTNNPALNKAQALIEWENCVNCDAKVKVINSCKKGLKTSLNGFEYLKYHFKKF